MHIKCILFVTISKHGAPIDMHSRVDFQRLKFEIGCDDIVATLAARHANLEKAIQDEDRRPAPDVLTLTGLKRRKLRVKDEIYRLRIGEPRALRRLSG